MTMLLTRLRVILPPGWALLSFLAAYALLEAPFLYSEWRLGQPLAPVRPSEYIVRIVAVGYGVFRVRFFHPAYLPEYRAWLERSPWTARKPLPGGPIAFGWEDLLPVAALAALAAARGPDEVVRIISLVLVGHLLFLGGALAKTGAPAFAFASAFGIGLVVRLWPDPRASLEAAVATYLIGWAGLRVSLARFPWPALEGVKTISLSDAAKAALEASCGWPFDQLQPGVAAAGRSSRRLLVASSLLAGWYLYAALAVLPNPKGVVRFVFWQGILMLSVSRLGSYCAGYVPPISFWGRVRNFRWIIPGYDQVFLAPLCTILVGVLALDRFRPPGLEDEVFLPAALTLASLLNVAIGPSLHHWRLTGQHRITATVANKNAEFVKVG